MEKTTLELSKHLRFEGILQKIWELCHANWNPRGDPLPQNAACIPEVSDEEDVVEMPEFDPADYYRWLEPFMAGDELLLAGMDLREPDRPEIHFDGVRPERDAGPV
jgi:hypothetical protein